MKLKNLTPLAACLILSGCVVGAAVDLAATTVVTAGKKDKKQQEKAHQPETQQAPPPPYTPAQTAPAHTRYITVDADGNVVGERDEP